jgi:hypothetical protein
MSNRFATACVSSLLLGIPLMELPVGKPFTFVVEVGAKLKVAIDGQQAMEVDYGNRTMRGTWSMAKNKGPAWVQDLRIEPLRAAGK